MEIKLGFLSNQMFNGNNHSLILYAQHTNKEISFLAKLLKDPKLETVQILSEIFLLFPNSIYR